MVSTAQFSLSRSRLMASPGIIDQSKIQTRGGGGQNNPKILGTSFMYGPQGRLHCTKRSFSLQELTHWSKYNTHLLIRWNSPYLRRVWWKQRITGVLGLRCPQRQLERIWEVSSVFSRFNPTSWRANEKFSVFLIPTYPNMHFGHYNQQPVLNIRNHHYFLPSSLQCKCT